MASFSLPTPLPTTTDVFGSNEKFENVLDASPIPLPLGWKQNLWQEFLFKCASVTHTLTHLKKLKSCKRQSLCHTKYIYSQYVIIREWLFTNIKLAQMVKNPPAVFKTWV